MLSVAGIGLPPDSSRRSKFLLLAHYFSGVRGNSKESRGPRDDGERLMSSVQSRGRVMGGVSGGEGPRGC